MVLVVEVMKVVGSGGRVGSSKGGGSWLVVGGSSEGGR